MPNERSSSEQVQFSHRHSSPIPFINYAIAFFSSFFNSCRTLLVANSPLWTYITGVTIYNDLFAAISIAGYVRPCSHRIVKNFFSLFVAFVEKSALFSCWNFFLICVVNLSELYCTRNILPLVCGNISMMIEAEILLIEHVYVYMENVNLFWRNA